MPGRLQLRLYRRNRTKLQLLLCAKRRSQAEQRGQYPLQRCPKNTFLTKNAPNFFIFLPGTLLRRLTAAIQGSGVPPPQEECLFQDKLFMATPVALRLLLCADSANFNQSCGRASAAAQLRAAAATACRVVVTAVSAAASAASTGTARLCSH